MQETFAYLRDVLGIRYLPFRVEAISETHQPNSTRAVSPSPPSISVPATEARPSASLEDLEQSLQNCVRCKLHKGRKKVVFGSGNKRAEIMFVGEGPGEQEDLQGLPFVGPAGELLTKMIEAMGLSRDQVYIANVVKCRPPMNRNPETDEIMECSPFLKTQIQLVNPKIIVALGTFAAQTLLRTDERISRLRGRVADWEGRKVISTFHPSYLLRNPSEKKSAWEDLKLAMTILGLAPKK